MEFWKNGGSETSSEENDRPERVKEERGSRRSYECTYCKRGFTNAQALGGHMNIHRKDRAKDKQVTGFSGSRKPNEDYEAYKDFGSFSRQQAQYYESFRAQVNLEANPRYQNNWPSPNSSLRIGPAYQGDSGTESHYGKDDEVDLELRLGHYP